eukprot:s2528_g4.t2
MLLNEAGSTAPVKCDVIPPCGSNLRYVRHLLGMIASESASSAFTKHKEKRPNQTYHLTRVREPLQPKLPSDRKSPTAMSERRGDQRIEPSPGGSSATYSSPAGDANSPAFLLKAARGPPLQDDDDRPEGEMPFALLAGAGGDSAQSGALWPTPAPAPTTFRGAEFPAPSVDAEETAYLRRNVEHLRFAKRRLEERVQDLRTRCEQLEQRKQQYKLLYEQQQQQLRDQQAMVGGSEEISQLHQQLSAISLLKDALNQENLDLFVVPYLSALDCRLSSRNPRCRSSVLSGEVFQHLQHYGLSTRQRHLFLGSCPVTSLPLTIQAQQLLEQLSTVGFVEACLQLSREEIVAKQQRILRARSLLSYDLVGGHRDAFSLLMDGIRAALVNLVSQPPTLGGFMEALGPSFQMDHYGLPEACHDLLVDEGSKVRVAYCYQSEVAPPMPKTTLGPRTCDLIPTAAQLPSVAPESPSGGRWQMVTWLCNASEYAENLAAQLQRLGENEENLAIDVDLARRLEESERHRLNREAEPVPQASCVICLDNLANLVTLPCKHLAMCTFCGFQEDLTECPICRTRIGEKMQIFTP